LRQIIVDVTLALYTQQEEISKKIKNLDGIQLAKGRQASIYCRYAQYKDALLRYKKQEKICRQMRNIKDLSKCLVHQAEVSIKIALKDPIAKRRYNKIQNSKRLAQEAYTIIKKTQFTLTIQYIELKYNNIQYLRLGDG